MKWYTPDTSNTRVDISQFYELLGKADMIQQLFIENGTDSPEFDGDPSSFHLHLIEKFSTTDAEPLETFLDVLSKMESGYSDFEILKMIGF